MEKISSILPATSRVTTVDLRNSGSIRGGMPTFGREVGVTAAAAQQAQQKEAATLALSRNQPDVLTTAARANQTLSEQMQMRTSKMDPKADIVKKMAENFFMNKAAANAAPAIQIRHDEESDMIIDDPRDLDIASEALEASPGAELKTSAESASAPEEQTLATGQYLDVRA